MAKILLVEDESKIARLVAGDLKLEGHHVEIVGDGATAVEKATSGTWDLMILDIMLPKMDGFEVCRAIRGQGSKLPVLMLTARGQDTDKVVGFQVGADDYLTKPFNILELLARVKAL